MKSRCLLIVSLAAAVITPSLSQIPRTLSYQGVLTDSLGNPKPDGTYSFTFRLYESAEGGSPIWTELKTLSVTRGLFSTILGDQVIIGASITFSRPYWLGIQVPGSPELSPRMALTASAYSISSLRSDTARFSLTAPQQQFADSSRIATTIPNNAVTTSKISDGAVTGVKIGAGQVVRRLNGMTDVVTLAAQGGATITSMNDSIIITAGSGGGGNGVQGVQNLNNTLDIINPNGPTVTVNVKNSAITTQQLADNSVTSAKISNGTILFTDLGQNGAGNGDVIKWNGTAWQPGSDNIGTGVFLPLVGGILAGPVTSTGSPPITMGKGNFGSGNSNAGTVAFVAGENNAASAYGSSIMGGSNNAATNDRASIGGGTDNIASGLSSHIGGGDGNSATGLTAVVGGGLGNAAGQSYASIGGGYYNSAIGMASAIAGGYSNIASGQESFVGGGVNNRARGAFSVVTGGGGVLVADSNSAMGYFSLVGGGVGNTAAADGAVIDGGFRNQGFGPFSSVGGGFRNESRGYASTIGGGSRNFSDSSYSTVGGGINNTAIGTGSVASGGNHNTVSGEYATVCGGAANVASGDYSIVLGGVNNAVRGWGSVALGLNAKANHGSSVVFKASAASDSVASGVNDQMVLMASNNFYITNDPGVAPSSASRLINTSTGAYLTTGGVWTNSSDRNLKENFAPVDGEWILERVSELPITMWNYRSEARGVKHIGPTAQDFHSLFGLGCDDRSISTVDPAGIALVAIKQLVQENSELKSELEELKAVVASLVENRERAK
jgi:hypothetical protein